MTAPAVQDVNGSVPKAHFLHSEMTNPAKNIECGTHYLALRIARAGSIAAGLMGFGTHKSAYAKSTLDCERCLQEEEAETEDCLHQIHV